MIDYDLDEFIDDEEENTVSDDTQKAIETIKNSGNLLDQIEALTMLAKGCLLSDEFFAGMSDCIKVVADRLGLTPMQAVLLLPFANMPDESVSRRCLAHFFKCSPLKLLRVDDDLTTLVHRRYLSRCGYREDGLCLSEIAEKAFGQNKPLPVVSISGLTPQEFMTEVRNLLDACVNDRTLSPDDLRQEMISLVDENTQLKLVQELKESVGGKDNILIVLYFCKRLVCDFQSAVTLEQLSRIFTEKDFYNIGRNLQKGKHFLVRLRVLEPSGEEMLIKEVYKLTDAAREKLLSEYDILVADEEEEHGRLNVVKASEVKAKSLFYSPANQKEINILADLLSVEHFNEIRQNLLDNNMRPGFNCLFYGAPGTGKTETVLQLARATGRDIMQVDISSIRDKWYGNTEKRAREIFDTYATLVKKCSMTPILLFNEADALLSVRTTVGNGHSTDKTENAIQNIFLEGMENLEGIMIATTNLTENLDSAFERRFIYKVKFEKPSLEAKTAIWKSLMPALSDADAQTLASQFDFSGGQIENIARKSFVEKLLFSKEPSLERLFELCSQEKLENATPRRAMGFGASKVA